MNTNRPLRRRGVRLPAPLSPSHDVYATASILITVVALGAPVKIYRPLRRGNASVMRGALGGKGTYYSNVTGSLALRGALTQEITSSLAVALAYPVDITASIRIVADTAAIATASIAIKRADNTVDNTASLAVYARATASATASFYIVYIPTLSSTASLVVENAAYDIAGVAVGALRAMLYTSAGVLVGGAPLLTMTSLARVLPLDAIGSASFSIPATDPLAAYVTEGNHVKLYHRDTGYLGEYIIQSTSVDVSGRTLSAQCVSIVQELVWANCLFRRNYSNIAVASVIGTSLISGGLYGLLYGTGWTTGAVDAGLGNISVIFQGETIYQAFDAIRKRLGKHFREGATARTLDFGAFGTDGGYRLIQPELITGDLSDLETATNLGLISSLSIESETANVVNRVIPFGAGQGLAALTLEKSTRATPYTIATATNPDASTYYYIEDAASVTAYGRRIAPLVKSDIVPISNSDADLANAANALYDVAAVYLARNSVKTVVYNANVLRCPAGVKAGDKVRVTYRGVVNVRGATYRWVNVDALLWVHSVNDSYDASGARAVALTLATTEQLPVDDSGIVLGVLEEIQIGKTHVQPYPSDFNDTFEEEIDAARSVTVKIDIDSRVLYLNSCRLHLTTKPLRATFSTAASGGGGTVTSASGGSSTQTSYGGGGHTHLINVYGGGPSGNTVYVSADGQFNSYVNRGVETNNAAAHTHDVAIPSHTHGVTLSTHTHPLTFGVSDDTQYPATIRVTVDGVDRTVALGGPWAATGGALDTTLDITTYVVNASGGLRQNHSVVFSCASGQGKIRVTTRAFTTVQAIAVTT